MKKYLYLLFLLVTSTTNPIGSDSSDSDEDPEENISTSLSNNSDNDEEELGSESNQDEDDSETLNTRDEIDQEALNIFVPNIYSCGYLSAEHNFDFDHEKKNIRLIVQATYQNDEGDDNNEEDENSKKNNAIIDQAKKIARKKLDHMLLYTIQLYKRNKPLKENIMHMIRLLLEAGATVRVEYPDHRPTKAKYWVSGKEGSPDKCIKRIFYGTIVQTFNRSFKEYINMEAFLEEHIKHMKFPQF